MVRIGVLLITCLLQSCSFMLALQYSPQAAFDSVDVIRERNERGIYAEVRDELERLGDPYCNLSLSGDDYPVTFAVPGLAYGYYRRQANAIVYPLGDHEDMCHEMAHAIIERSKPSETCMSEIIAAGVTELGICARYPGGVHFP